MISIYGQFKINSYKTLEKYNDMIGKFTRIVDEYIVSQEKEFEEGKRIK